MKMTGGVGVRRTNDEKMRPPDLLFSLIHREAACVTRCWLFKLYLSRLKMFFLNSLGHRSLTKKHRGQTLYSNQTIKCFHFDISRTQ